MRLRIKKTGVMFFAAMISVIWVTNRNEKTEKVFMPLNNYTVVIDAGHGGWDPGKTSEESMDEKDINLDIAKKTGLFLEENGADVYFTRDDENALGETKAEDMKNRKRIMNERNADIMVSIHQNSFGDGDVKGSQVFYYKNSEEGKKLAQYIQNSLKMIIDKDNKRTVKENDSYYMLKNTDIPSVIIECGFLSNDEEKELLNNEEYRFKIAWAIYNGIKEYFEEESKGKENLAKLF